LFDQGILYAPDYVINAGGIIIVSFEENYDVKKSTQKVEEIYQTLLNIFQQSTEKNIPTGVIADNMAREIIKKGGKKFIDT
jgi:leucine dehydrogenase